MWKIDNKKDPQERTTLEQTVKNNNALQHVSNMFNGTSLTLYNDLDQDT